MKALILAGGKGTRLRPLTDSVPKQLLPVANKPILFYALEQIRESGISDIGIVVSPETGRGIREAIANSPIGDVQIAYIVQSEPLGLAHAVKTAREFLADSPFLVILGDNLVQGGVKSFVDEFNEHQPDALILLKEVADPSRFGVAELDSMGKVTNLVEKPEEPKSNLAVVGVYLFTPEIHQAIAQIKPSPRGELEITDAIQEFLRMGKEVRNRVLAGWWLDTGQKKDLLEANRIVLNDCLARDIRGKVDSVSQVKGRVEIGQGTIVNNSLIHGPVSIAEDCRIDNSLIKPFSSIGAGTVIENSSIENVVIMESCRISKVNLVDDIIIRNTELTDRGENLKVAKTHRPLPDNEVRR